MPVERIVSAAAYGAAYGLFPIGWIVIWALLPVSPDARYRQV